MLTLRQSPFDLLESDLFQKLEQQLSSAKPHSHPQNGERMPAAEVHDGPEAYTIALDLPGVDRASIDVKATDRTLVISAERRACHPPETTASNSEIAQAAPLLSEFRYGTWSRSFRFPGGINRESLQAHYRDGLLTVTAPKAQNLTTVQVQVEG